jgi:hypothetical protein
MAPRLSSSRKVPYDLRVRKQIERRMIMDTLADLPNLGFPLKSYSYVGCGSPFYVDFILMHKHLGLTQMKCVEHDTTIKQRMTFNLPNRYVELQIGELSDAISDLKIDKKYILWLDYDYKISKDQISDVLQATYNLSRGSVLIMTIDIESLNESEDKISDKVNYLKSIGGDFLNEKITRNNFDPDKVPFYVSSIFKNVIIKGLVQRKDIVFKPLFNFLYDDSHLMLTLGGVFLSRDDDKRLNDSGILGKDYIVDDFLKTPFTISVPLLTKNEKMLLDQNIPFRKNWKPKKLELPDEDEKLKQYEQIYRFYPNYAEIVL